ncbi:MAG: hypothetical protein NWE89_17485 [Candidatus Bathyarchaeota archaeon]|nr:hypothetical protein [Candidatus Bathyarchaeota archaeon]
MKYILFWETPEQPTPREEGEQAQEACKDEKKYGKTILQPHFYAPNKGISIVEIDNQEQLANRRALVYPVKIKAMPLLLGTMLGKAMVDQGKR